jgi:hypothetical protein
LRPPCRGPFPGIRPRPPVGPRPRTIPRSPRRRPGRCASHQLAARVQVHCLRLQASAVYPPSGAQCPGWAPAHAQVTAAQPGPPAPWPASGGLHSALGPRPRSFRGRPFAQSRSGSAADHRSPMPPLRPPSSGPPAHEYSGLHRGRKLPRWRPLRLRRMRGPNHAHRSADGLRPPYSRPFLAPHCTGCQGARARKGNKVLVSFGRRERLRARPPSLARFRPSPP